jgi:hypothetical protein
LVKITGWRHIGLRRKLESSPGKIFHDNKILNQLRVRASVGTAGNQYFQSYLVKLIIIIILTGNIYRVAVIQEQEALG